MTPTIVVGYDGTDHGDDALALGRLLAGIAGAELVIACAYPDDPLGESAAALEVARGMRDDAEGKLERARTWLARAGAAAGAGAAGDGGVSLRAVAGASPAHVLHELAEASGALAIAVGASHHGRALRLLTGSTPDAVLDHAPCPVAVAPDGYRDAVRGAGGVRQMAVAYDGSPEARHALEVAASYARGAGARLRVVTALNSAAVGVYPPPPLDVAAYEELSRVARSEAHGRLEEAIAALGADVDAESAVLDGDIVSVLVQEAKTDDLLFTGSGAKGPFRRVLLGSVSTHLLRDAACPVVVVPRGSGEGGA
jgi:nucleotide-binding universal stress UspA family protein